MAAKDMEIWDPASSRARRYFDQINTVDLADDFDVPRFRCNTAAGIDFITKWCYFSRFN
jgi:hypothetical protein